MKIGYDWPMAEMDSHKWVKAVGRENHGSCMAVGEFMYNRRRKTKNRSPRKQKLQFIWCMALKGHGNEANFLRFLQKLDPRRSLTLTFEPFRFWLRIRGDIRNRKTTPGSPSQGLDTIACSYNIFQTFK
jgi:hypothetical protein